MFTLTDSNRADDPQPGRVIGLPKCRFGEYLMEDAKRDRIAPLQRLVIRDDALHRGSSPEVAEPRR